MCPAKVGEFRELPGPLGQGILEEWDRVMAKTLLPSLVVPKRAEGVELEDVDGNKYLQFNSGISVANFGYGSCLQPAVDAISEVYKETGMLMMNGAYYPNVHMLEAANKLLDVTPIRGGRGRFFGCTSGTIGIEVAMKAAAMARDHRNPVAHPEKQVFMHLAKSFHGRSHGASSLMDQEQKGRFHGLSLPYKQCELAFPRQGDEESCGQFYEDLDRSLKLYGPSFILGVFTEIVQGEGGINVIDRGALTTLEEKCNAAGIPLIIDEVQTGFGRCGGDPWAYTLYGIEPDIVVFGKGAGYGVLPVCGMIVSDEFTFQEYGENGGTFGADPVFGAVLNEAISELHEQELAANSREMGDYFLQSLRRACRGMQYVGDIRGLGLLIGVEFCNPGTGAIDPVFSKNVWKACENFGLLTLPSGIAVNRFAPPLCVTRKHIDDAIVVFGKAYAEAVRNYMG
jgi:4-aminobutyrate aminotransferase